MLFFIFFLLAKFGITCTFNIHYMANGYYFPTQFAATAMGICNFLACVSSAFSYPISQIDEPEPMYMFTSLCAFTVVCCLFLKDPDHIDAKDG